MVVYFIQVGTVIQGSAICSLKKSKRETDQQTGEVALSECADGRKYVANLCRLRHAASLEFHPAREAGLGVCQNEDCVAPCTLSLCFFGELYIDQDKAVWANQIVI